MDVPEPAAVDLDAILALQMVVARLGERELCNWWNVDLAYKLGGADFLGRLTDPVMAPLAVGEGLLRAAGLKEDELLAALPAGAVSLFRLEAGVQVALGRRWRHFKNWPDDLPATLAELLNPETDWTAQSLGAYRDRLCAGTLRPRSEATAFGLLVHPEAGWTALDLARALALCFDPAAKGRFTLNYCRGSHGD